MINWPYNRLSNPLAPSTSINYSTISDQYCISYSARNNMNKRLHHVTWTESSYDPFCNDKYKFYVITCVPQLPCGGAEDLEY